MNATKLTKGEKYDVSAMRLIGWTEGDGSGSEGYELVHYFGDDGEYKGADECGIEPIVCAAADDDDNDEIIIVNDGAYRWGADREELEEAMIAQGWKREGRYWIEPDMGGGEDYNAAYNRLCNAVQPAEGYEVGERSDEWNDLPEMRCTAEDTRRWRVTE